MLLIMDINTYMNRYINYGMSSFILTCILHTLTFFKFKLFYSLTKGLWPVWNIFTPVILFVLFMGFVVTVAMLPNFWHRMFSRRFLCWLIPCFILLCVPTWLSMFFEVQMFTGLEIWKMDESYKSRTHFGNYRSYGRLILLTIWK